MHKLVSKCPEEIYPANYEGNYHVGILNGKIYYIYWDSVAGLGELDGWISVPKYNATFLKQPYFKEVYAELKENQEREAKRKAGTL